LTACPPSVTEDVEGDPKWKVGIGPSDWRNESVSRGKAFFPVEECREEEQGEDEGNEEVGRCPAV